MRNIQKRTLSLLVVIALLMSFIVPAVQIPASAATVTYKYSGSYIYNWGNRDEVATFLSPNAVSFYQSNGVAYADLAAMSGTATVSDVPSTPLYRELQDLMADNHDYKTGYDATRELYQYTDCQDNGNTTTQISTFYTGKLVGPAWDSGKTWNREHVWPNSKGLNGQDENDIMMLRPANPNTNSSRGNEAFGESGSYYDPNELGQNVRGDVARILLYQYVRWGNTSNMWGTSGVMESKEILLKWMEEDPVDTWEMGRNDSVESITGTRNVFVDYPELVFILFGEEVPANYSTPSNGTSVELERATVQYSENGHIASLASAYAGQKVTLPEHAGIVLPGYKFVGWVESTVADTTEKPAAYAAGSEYTLAADTTLYALYSITEEGEGGTGTGGYVETALADIESTDVVVITMTYTDGKVYALNNSKGTSAAPTANIVTVTGDKLSAEPDDVLKWNIANNGGNLTIYPNGTTAAWLYCTSTNNGVRVGTNANKVFTIDATSGYLKHTATGRYVGVYRTNPDWRCYTNTTGNTANQTLKFYVLTAGGATTTYTTTIAPCEHENTEDRAKVAAQCEIAGTEAGVFCLDCQTFISGGAEIAALEHVWVAGAVTPPTETQQGYTTYTCQNGCGQTKQDDFTDALGVKYTVKFSVPTGVTAIADAQVDGIEGMTLPVPSGTPGAGYSFVGWAESAVDATTTAPAVLGEFYIPTSNITLYAVYTYVVGGSGRTEYTLVTSADELGLGHEIVIVGVEDATNYAMSTTQNGNNRGRTEITVSNNVASWDKDAAVQLITLEEGTVDGTYAMNVGTGYLYAASASSNYLRTQDSIDGNASWLITFEDGVVTVKAQGANTRNWLRHNTGSDIFSCYGNGQADIYLYTKGIPGTTYYSTLSCTHDNAQSIPEIEPECEVNGNETGVFCPDCQTYISGGAVIPMRGHNMVAGTVVAPTATEQGYTIYNCANGCGKTEQRDYTDPTGEVFEVSFIVPTGVAEVEAMNINALTGATLPTAGAPTGEHTYVFAGWADAAITEATTTVPVLYTGNYKPTEDVTLFAVYTYAVGGGTSTGESWKLVTNAANLTSGDEIAIVGVKDTAYYAMSTTQNNNNRGSVAATVDTATQTLTMTNDIQVITVEAGEVENTIALNVGTGYLYAASAGSNYLRTQETNNENGSWSVEIAATGVATLKAQGTNTKNWMRFNNTNDPNIFSCYGSGQADIYLYEKVADDGATVYYTSVATGATDPEDPDVPVITEGTLLTELPADGSYIIIVNGTYALGKTASGKKIAATAATVANSVLTTTDDMARLKVVVEGDKYIFMLGEKYLTSAATGNGLSYADTLTDCGRWTFTSAGDGLWYINNVGANHNGNYNQALEYYSGFTTYGIKETDIYQMQLFAANAPQSSEPETPQDPDGTELTIAEAVAKGSLLESGTYTATKYAVTGVVDELLNATHGNMYIADEDGNRLYIYGVYDANGVNRYDAMETKPVVGDTVTLLGYIGNYNGSAQMLEGWMTNYVPGEGVEEPEYPEADSALTITEANDLGASMIPGAYTPGKYYVTGEITEVYNTTHGNMYIKDEAGNTLTVYGTWDSTGVIRYDALETKPVAGDQITVYGVIGNYNGTAQMKNGWITAHTPGAEESPAEPIKLMGYNLTLGNSLSINFNVTKAVMDQYEDVYMVFQVEGRDPVKVTEYFIHKNSDTDIRYNFAFDGVSILDLNVPVLATVYGTFNGVEYSYTAKNAVSVLSYCNSKIANGAADSETAGVCANLLKYAIAAEAYMNAQYGTATEGHLVNILTDTQLAAIETYATPDDQVSVEKTSSNTVGTKVKFSNQSLEMVSRITLRYKITIIDSTLDTSKLTFQVTYTDYNGNAASQDYTFEDLEYDANTGEYVLSFSGFNATQMKDLAKCTIYIDGVEHCYYANSIENYCCTAINSSKQPEVVKYLAKRISLYGDACYAAYGK